MKRASTLELNFGSGRIGRLGEGPLRGISFFLLSLLRALCAVLGAALFTIRSPRRVERSANNVVAHARKILDAAASYKNHTVLLKVVPDARNVRGHFLTVGETNARNFAKGRVRLLRGDSFHLRAHAATLRVAGNFEAARRQIGVPGFRTRLDHAKRAGLDLFCDF